MQNVENGVVWGRWGSLNWGSCNVFENSTNWQSACKFLLAFHHSYVRLLLFLRYTEI